MKSTLKASIWALTLIALIGAAPVASGSSLTLGTAAGINHFVADDWLISGATVSSGTPQPAAYEAYHWWDKNDDGVWGAPDTKRKAIGTYDNGLFGLYSLCQSLGGFSSVHQYVRSRGILIIDDLMVTTDDPSPPATIPVSLNFHVSGETSHFNNDNQREVISSALDMSIHINGTIFNGEYKWAEYSSESETVTGLGTQIAAGAFAESFSATITTGTANVPVNTPFTLQVEFVLTASAGGGSGGAWGGMAFDAMNTAGFLSGAPIFNDLPAGYTVSSVDVGIVNNMFGGAATGIESGTRSNATWGGIKSLFNDR